MRKGVLLHSGLILLQGRPWVEGGALVLIKGRAKRSHLPSLRRRLLSLLK